MSARTKAYLTLLFVSAIWGIAGPVIKFTLTSFPPLVFLTYRFFLSSIVGLIALSLSPLHWPKSPSDQLKILVYCFFTSTVSLGLLFLGYQYTSALSGSVINALYPIMVAAAGVVWLHEHVTSREKLGLTIALAGTILVIVEPLTASPLIGNLLILASIVVSVGLAILAKVLFRNSSLSPTGITHLSFIIGFITTLPFTLIINYKLSIINLVLSAPLSAHLGVLYMALLSGTLAYSLWHRAQKSIEIGETAIFSYTYPFFAIPFSYFWLHEPITLVFILACLIIAAGVLIAQQRPTRRPNHPR